MPIHQKLKHLRVVKNLSQLLIAEKLHISQNAYSLIENGKTKIDEQRILQLARILDVHPVELLADDAVNFTVNDKVKGTYDAHLQTLTASNKELMSQLTHQLIKKDEQIEYLLLQINQLSQLLNLVKQ